ncbi:MAG: NTF2 fold immunity protein [Muribaculaceae bacterium]
MVKKGCIVLAVSVLINTASCNRTSNASVKNTNDSANNQIVTSTPTRVIEVSTGERFPTEPEQRRFPDVLPTYDRAFDVAYVILSQFYGSRCSKYYPYTAYLYNDSIWIIKGSRDRISEGGCPYIELNKHDGRVLTIEYGK